jgi:phosphoglycolate phosphatase-like HAD superfamily hydrolase
VDDVTRAWRSTRTVLIARELPAPDLAGFLGSFRLPLKAFFADLGVPGGELGDAEAEWNAAVGSQEAVLMPGVVEMLDSLEGMGVAVGIVSAADAGVVGEEIRALGLGGRFAFVVGSASPKRAALARLAGAHGRVAYLGDAEHDVWEARAAGVAALGFGSGYRPGEALAAAGAERVVSDLREVPGAIFG